jgi:hypothetical protein
MRCLNSRPHRIITLARASGACRGGYSRPASQPTRSSCHATSRVAASGGNGGVRSAPCFHAQMQAHDAVGSVTPEAVAVNSRMK